MQPSFDFDYLSVLMVSGCMPCLKLLSSHSLLKHKLCEATATIRHSRRWLRNADGERMHLEPAKDHGCICIAWLPCQKIWLSSICQLLYIGQFCCREDRRCARVLDMSALPLDVLRPIHRNIAPIVQEALHTPRQNIRTEAPVVEEANLRTE